MQTKKHSWWEALTNVAVGYISAIGLQMMIYPFYGIHLQISQQFSVAGVFLIISLLRSYLIRRLWNHYHKSRADKENENIR